MLAGAKESQLAKEGERGGADARRQQRVSKSEMKCLAQRWWEQSRWSYARGREHYISDQSLCLVVVQSAKANPPCAGCIRRHVRPRDVFTHPSSENRSCVSHREEPRHAQCLTRSMWLEALGDGEVYTDNDDEEVVILFVAASAAPPHPRCTRACPRRAGATVGVRFVSGAPLFLPTSSLSRLQRCCTGEARAWTVGVGGVD